MVVELLDTPDLIELNSNDELHDEPDGEPKEEPKHEDRSL